MMKCKDIRELLSADPQCQEPEVLGHFEDCSDCTAWRIELRAFEMQLSEALRVDTPKGLEASIVKQLHSPQQSIITSAHRIIPNRRWQPALAIAASVLLIVGLVATLNHQPNTELHEQQMLAWLSTQQPAEHLGRHATKDEVSTMFREVGAELVADIGTIHYCQVTNVNEQKVGYFVVSGDRGPIGVMLITGGAKKILTQGPLGAGDSEAQRLIRDSIRWI